MRIISKFEKFEKIYKLKNNETTVNYICIYVLLNVLLMMVEIIMLNNNDHNNDSESYNV